MNPQPPKQLLNFDSIYAIPGHKNLAQRLARDSHAGHTKDALNTVD